MTLLLTQMFIFKLRRKTAKPPVTREDSYWIDEHLRNSVFDCWVMFEDNFKVGNQFLVNWLPGSQPLFDSLWCVCQTNAFIF